MSKYHVSQIENGKLINYGDFKAKNAKEAVKLAYNTAKINFPQLHFNKKTPFKVKEIGGKTKEVKYHE